MIVNYLKDTGSTPVGSTYLKFIFMLTIEQINDILEKEALKYPDYPSWQEYYRGLKNFHLLDKFFLSSIDSLYRKVIINTDGNQDIKPNPHPIIQYIEENKLQYKFTPYTGYCVFEKA